MNEIGIALIWCALQVTVVAILAAGLYALARPIGPSGRSHVALTSLIVIVVLSVFVFSPWPRWWDWSATGDVEIVSEVESDRVTGRNAGDPPKDARGTESPPLHTNQQAFDDAAGGSAESATTFWTLLLEELRQTPVERRSEQWRWPAIVAVFVLVGLGVSLMRLLAGLLAVRIHRLNSRPVGNPELLELVDVLRAELSCRRPMILLPAGWSDWNNREQRAVLAHEIAHICRNDFFAWVWAQLGLVLHFYHPLVHWLVGRLRLEQELAADAIAAEISGGQAAYLRILADMALRQTDRPLSWPARTFLPTRRTFLRRIEMLRDTRRLRTTFSSATRTITIGLLVLAGLAAAGVRGPSGLFTDAILVAASAQLESTDVAAAQQSRSKDVTAVADPLALYAGASQQEKIELAYVPADAVALIAIRPAQILNRPEMKPLLKLLQAKGKLDPALRFPLETFEQITFVILRTAGSPKPNRGPIPAFGGMIIRSLEASDFKMLRDSMVTDAVEQKWAGQVYYKSSRPGHQNCYFRPDDRTIVVDLEQNLQRFILSGKRAKSKLVKTEAWKKVQDGHLAAALDVQWLRSLIAPANRRVLSPRRGAAELAVFSPLWEESNSLVFGAKLDKKLELQAIATCRGTQGAQRVKETIAAARILLRNVTKGFRKQIKVARSSELPVILSMMNVGEQLLDDARLTQTGNVARIETATYIEPVLIAALAMSIEKAATTARHSQAKNNLKQIGLAMHNYHDALGRFPPAVVMGPDGKTPHSWRVELLPFLGRAADSLYAEYKMDEPWDSPHNRNLLAKMPDVFRISQVAMAHDWWIPSGACLRR